MLNELLSPAMNSFVQALYGEFGHLGNGHSATLVRQLGEILATSASGSRLWSDAEDFLGQLDAAARDGDSPSARRVGAAIRKLLGSNVAFDLPEMDALARGFVAGACCAFLKDVDTSSEPWHSYIDWANALRPWDSILSFNYDRVLENLGGVFDIASPRLTAGPPAKPQVFKLHGSVDWQRQSGSPPVYEITNKPEFALTCSAGEIGIATPGPTKRVATGELKMLWEQALTRLERAEAVIFVGYRFPPSDSEARTKLLAALQRNAARRLNLHVVLGPDRGPDSLRLKGLLQYVMLKAGREEWPIGTTPLGFCFSIQTHALYAEDFLTVWHRASL